MPSDRISTKILAGFLASTDALIEDGKSIIIDGLIVNNQNGFFGQFFKIKSTKGDQIIDLYIPAGTTITFFSSFISDGGTLVKAGNEWVSYTIFYRGSG